MRRARSYGFSLIELAVALVILAVLLSVGVPVFSRHRSNTLLRSTVQQMVSDLQTARTTATQFSGPTVASADTGVLLNKNISVKPIVTNQGVPPQQQSSIDSYQILGHAGNGPTQKIRQTSLDGSIKLSVQGAATSADLQNAAGAGLVFGPADQAVVFAGNGSLVNSSTVVIKMTNNITQFRVTVNHLGSVTSTEEPAGTP